MKKEKCPNCNSTMLYREISISAKQYINTGKIADIEKDNIDNVFDPLYCKKCGWSDDERFSQISQ
jgi:predicted nucleic-acid-binding Zn-ribbon protein